MKGGFQKHKRKDNYKSRGLIAKELLKENSLQPYLENLYLFGIEPFMMIVADWNNHDLNLVEVVWDEHEKHITKHINEPKICSSSTLYTDEIKELRNNLFQQWHIENELTAASIFQFNHSETGDKKQAVLMKRS